MTIKILVTITSVNAFSSALAASGMSQVDEMRALIRFCAAVHTVEPVHSMSELYSALCTAIDLRNSFAPGRWLWHQPIGLRTPSQREFCRRLKAEVSTIREPVVVDANNSTDAIFKALRS
jgi:hypothetical protein